MATLSLTNTFIAGTLAKASEVNQNFTDLVNWSSGNIQNDNLGTMNGTISWTIATGVKAISIANSGNEGSIGITQSVGLNPNKATIRIIDNAAQTAGDAEIYVSMSSLSSTIPILKLDYAGMQVLSVKNSRIELPVRTRAQRDAISSPANGSILVVEDSPESRHRGIHIKSTEGWQMVSMPAGACIPFAGANVPDGWLLCDGSEYSETTYATLFAAIGTTWNTFNGQSAPAGGNFRVPKMARMVPMGSGGSQISGPSTTLGSAGGAETHTLSLGQMPSHGHSGTFATAGHTHTQGSLFAEVWVNPAFGSNELRCGNQKAGSWTSTANKGFTGSGTSGGSETTGVPVTGTTDGPNASAGVGSNGSDQAHNNVQPSAVFNYIIKW